MLTRCPKTRTGRPTSLSRWLRSRSTSPDIPPAGTNLLLAGSLDDMVYAFNADTGGIAVATINLAGLDCGSGSAPFDNNYDHSPGGTNLIYYGVVATPVIDIYSGTAPTPTAFVVSACVPDCSAPEDPVESRRDQPPDWRGG